MATMQRARAQSGVSLIIVLIFIVILSGVAALTVRRVVFGESVARNSLDLEIARQSAEAALRDAERDILLARGVPGATCDRGIDRPIADAYQEPSFGSDCPRGQCRFGGLTTATYYADSNASTGTNPAPWWPGTGTRWQATPPSGCTFTGGVPLGTFTGTPGMAGVSRQPEYMFEYMTRGSGDDVYFRITARGWGLDKNTEVVLQSYFKRTP